MTKIKSLRSGHLLITGRASILILILRSLGRRMGRSNEATKVSLTSCNTTHTSGHLTHLISENVKASIYALKLHHNRLKSHTTTWRRGRSGMGWRSCRLGLWLLRSKLGLTLSNKRRTDGTHDGEMSRLGIGDRGMKRYVCMNNAWTCDMQRKLHHGSTQSNPNST